MATFVTTHRAIYAALSPEKLGGPLAGKTVSITGAGRGVSLSCVLSAGFLPTSVSSTDLINVTTTVAASPNRVFRIV
jgi:hypothetical protein